MTDIYTNHMLPYQSEQDPYKGLSDDDRFCLAFYQVIGYLVAALFTIIICALFSGCTTSKVVEQHHHHHYQADTLAIQSQVDKRMNGWHAQMDSSWHQSWQEYRASWFSNDDQKEHITETITTYIDSLGREVRQEQRTTDRTISKMQQQFEQRISQEFEHSLRVAVDSVNGILQQRFDALQTHLEQSDSTTVQHGLPASEKLPWYKHCWQSIKDSLLIIAIIALLLITRNIWFPWCINLFRRLWKK